MKKTKAPTPEPIVVMSICSVCGLNWDDHPGNPTVADCIELLKKEVEKKRYSNTTWYTVSCTTPYQIPYTTYPSTTAPYQVTWGGNASQDITSNSIETKVDG